MLVLYVLPTVLPLIFDLIFSFIVVYVSFCLCETLLIISSLWVGVSLMGE